MEIDGLRQTVGVLTAGIDTLTQNAAQNTARYTAGIDALTQRFANFEDVVRNLIALAQPGSSLQHQDGPSAGVPATPPQQCPNQQEITGVPGAFCTIMGCICLN